MSQKRSRKAIALELLAWFVVAVVTAVVLVLLSDSILPANF
jgi:hypothetical protein